MKWTKTPRFTPCGTATEVDETDLKRAEAIRAMELACYHDNRKRHSNV